MDRFLVGLRAAAEPTRLRLMALCARSELAVGELARILDQSQPRVSRHLKLLCEAGLVDRFPEGASAFFRLAQRGEGAALAADIVARLPEDDPVLVLDGERLVAIEDERRRTATAFYRAHEAQWTKLRSLYVDEREVEQALLGLLPQSGLRDLLDIGTGTGRILDLVADRVDHAVGIDLSRDMLALARTRLTEAGLRNCAVRHADMYRLPWPAGSFDVVTIHQALHFADRPAAVIAQAARVLRPGGRLLIVDFAAHGLSELFADAPHSRPGFSDEEVLDWCRAQGLQPEPVGHLPGDPLTISIWQAVLPAKTSPGVQP